MDTKLTVRVPRQVLKNAKRYAKENHTTLTELISSYLQQIPSQEDLLNNAPLVRQLTGTLSPNLSREDYQKYLDEKYGR